MKTVNIEAIASRACRTTSHIKCQFEQRAKVYWSSAHSAFNMLMNNALLCVKYLFRISKYWQSALSLCKCKGDDAHCLLAVCIKRTICKHSSHWHVVQSACELPSNNKYARAKQKCLLIDNFGLVFFQISQISRQCDIEKKRRNWNTESNIWLSRTSALRSQL